MKQQVLVGLLLAVMGCYLGWSLVTGSLRIRGVSEPIRRQTNPREYWSYMRIILFVYVTVVVAFMWMFR